MKKLILAAAIAAIASNAMALEVYNADGTTVKVFGEIRTRLVNEQKNGEGAEFDMSDTKLGVSAAHAINEDLTATALLKYDADVNQDDSGIEVNEGWLELASNKFGAVKIGNQATVYDAMLGNYDASTLFGGEAKLADDKDGTGTVESAATYTWSNDSFTVKAQHSFADENNYTLNEKYSTKTVKVLDPDTGSSVDKTQDVALKADFDKQMALGVSWASDFGLTLVGAYTDATLDNVSGLAASTESKEIDVETVGFEADYSFGAWTVGGALTKMERESDKNKEIAEEFNAIGLGVAYAFDNGINAFAGYEVVEKEDQRNGISSAADETETTYYNVGVDYRPHPSVKTFVEYAHSKKVQEKVGKDDSTSAGKWGVGVRVYF